LPGTTTLAYSSIATVAKKNLSDFPFQVFSADKRL
jgi:hypothetical protein